MKHQQRRRLENTYKKGALLTQMLMSLSKLVVGTKTTHVM